MNKESEFEELLESAYRYIEGELGLEYVSYLLDLTSRILRWLMMPFMNLCLLPLC